MKTATINVRIEGWIKDQIRKGNIDVSEVVRASLISEIEKKRLQRIAELAAKAQKTVKKMGLSEITSEIRQMRERR